MCLLAAFTIAHYNCIPFFIFVFHLQLTSLLLCPSPFVEKHTYLRSVAENCEDLYFAALIGNVEELMPIVYTPTVGEACQKHSLNYANPTRPNRANGLYISLKDRGNVRAVLDRYPAGAKVSCVVMTDGERILGLGDQGANGMGIPVGKLALYTACAGIDPSETIPITLDVGTNNKAYLKDKCYIGLRAKRDRSSAYDELVEETIRALKDKYGESCMIQFEDFGNSNAFRLLEKYQNNTCCFNDDIQGTASVVVAGFMASRAITGIDLKDHRFLFLGAGEAGVGIANLIAYSMHIESGGEITLEDARKKIHLVDSKGLVTSSRGKDLAHHKVPYAHEVRTNDDGASAPANLIDCVKLLKPTALIGVSAIPNTFSREVIEEMAANNANPIIFALSNPTSKAECTAEEAYKFSGGRCVFASGSPFAPVMLGDDVVQNECGGAKRRPFRHKSNLRIPGQGNNAYVFPGIGLGIIASGATRVSDHDMYIAAKSLSQQVKKEQILSGCVYPPLSAIRDVSLKIATDVSRNAYEAGTATVLPKPRDMSKFIKDRMYNPWDPRGR